MGRRASRRSRKTHTVLGSSFLLGLYLIKSRWIPVHDTSFHPLAVATGRGGRGVGDAPKFLDLVFDAHKSIKPILGARDRPAGTTSFWAPFGCRTRLTRRRLRWHGGILGSLTPVPHMRNAHLKVLDPAEGATRSRRRSHSLASRPNGDRVFCHPTLEHGALKQRTMGGRSDAWRPERSFSPGTSLRAVGIGL